MTTIGFIGLGLIGGSIARAIRKHHPDYKILAYNPNKDTLITAVSEHVVDIPCDKTDIRFQECDVIFLCAPVNANISYLKTLKDIISSDSILTDVGSVKGTIHQEAVSLHLDANFIGGHPMAGSEKTGYENSADYLIENAYYILTPCETVKPEQALEFQKFIRSLGALPLIMSPSEHDYITAGVSHLPHIIASILVNEVKQLDGPSEYMKMIAAGGFKDITRIASSSPEMWQHICLSNKDMILKTIDKFDELLMTARACIADADKDGLYSMFESSRYYRDSITDITSDSNKSHVLYCDIYDETGGIAAVTSVLAQHNISIKNIGIIHNREFEEGVLKIEFYQEDACKKGAAILKQNSYLIHRRT